MATEDRCCSAGSVVLSFLIGGVVGAGLAILLAPSSGEETRKKIKQWTDTAKDRASGLRGDLREKVTHLTEKGKEYVEQKKQILSSAIDAGREAMEKEKERLSRPAPESAPPTD